MSLPMSALPDPVPTPETVGAGPTEVEAGGVLTVDLGALTENWSRLGSKALPVECGAVVKADAYGCGIEEVG